MPPAEERKVVSVLFCDLVGFTAAAEAADPEDVRRWLTPYQRTLKTTVERFGGTVEKFAGDAILAVFGAPLSREDDAERAVRAGLAILDELAGGTLQVRIGIETGEALVEINARPELGEPFVTGLVVNTAARLQTSAPIGAVVVGAATYAATSRVFEYEPLEPVAAKGIRRPLQRWQAGEARARVGADVIRDLTTPMVGRQRDLSLLRMAFDKAVAERSPQFVTLLGEPGIGKSRLVAELGAELDKLDDMIIWREGRCLPYGEGPFWPIAEIVKAQAGIRESDPPARAAEKLEEILPEADRSWLRARVRPLVGAEADGKPVAVAQEESFAAWRELLESFAESYPTVLVLEDLHWARDALLAFVDHLVEWVKELPLLVVITARPELLERGAHWTRGQQNAWMIGLAPLSGSETDQLFGELLTGDRLPPRTRADLVGRADGNPLYAEELARMVNELGPGSVALPSGITSIIAARLDTLEPDRKALLANAAVIGRVFWAEAVAALVDREPADVVQELQELARKELVRPIRQSSLEGQREYSFWHSLTRDVAYSQVPRAARSARHVAAADWLESQCSAGQGDTTSVIAHHLGTALQLADAVGDLELVEQLAPRARGYLRRAAEQAMNLDATEAMELLDQALGLTPEGDPDRPEVLARWGWAAFLTGRLDDALAAYRSAVAGFDAVGDLVGVARALRASTYAMSSMEESLATIDRVVSIFESLGPSEDLVGALAGQAVILTVASRRNEAIAAANRSLRMAEELGYGVPQRALEARGLSRVGNGDTGGVVDMKDALSALLDQGKARDAAVTWLNYGFVVWQIEGPRAALETLKETEEFTQRRRLAELRQQLSCTVLELMMELGQTEEVIAACRAQLDDPGPAFITLRRIEVLAALSRAELELGVAGARASAEEAYRLGIETDWPDFQAIGGAPAATARAADGDRAGVQEVLERLLGLEVLTGSHEFAARLPTFVRAGLAVDLPELAERVAGLIVPLLPMREYSLATAAALLAEYRGDTGAAIAGFGKVAADWRTFGNLLEEKYALAAVERLRDQSADLV
ncbi:ATP-binding protein [Kribbella ginsengisoli]|uniref:AAA family ATPase n=1 Tax=Kribbella ginsengisoli TaxID=363865 RepID=A0ABP6YW56_9ACTN